VERITRASEQKSRVGAFSWKKVHGGNQIKKQKAEIGRNKTEYDPKQSGEE
jgi:hypothetical protein